MVNWKYNKEVETKSFKPIPIGNYKCRIEAAEESTSKSGNEMIKLELKVSGQSGKLWFYVVFMADHKDITDSNLKSIYESFKIEEGNLNSQSWIGKVGGVKVKHEMYNGENSSKVHYFLNQAQQSALPAWSEENAQVAPTSEPVGWGE